MANIFKMLSDRGRTITRRMVTQNTSKNQCPPLIFRTKLFLASHIEHTDWLFQFIRFNKLNYTVGNKSTSTTLLHRKLLKQYIQISLIFLKMFAMILIDSFPICNNQIARRISKIEFHLQILMQAPIIEIFLHMFYNNVDIFVMGWELGIWRLMGMHVIYNIVQIYIHMDKVQEQQAQDELILPNSSFVVFWSLFSSVLVFTYFGVAVFEISFQTVINREYLNKSYFAAILFVYCVIDTLIFVNIGIIVDGRLINNRYKNFINYVKTYLVYTDVVVLLVLIARIIIGTIDEQKHDYNIVESCLDLVIVLKFLNIRQYQKILKYYYFNEWSILVFEFLKNLILLTIVCHVVGCGFFLIDVSVYEARWYDKTQCWIFSAPAVFNMVNQQGQAGLYYAPLNQQYLYSIYFAIVTLSTIAYGDISPLNQTEVAYLLLILTFLLMLYIYIFTQIYEAVNWFSRRSRSIKQEKYKLAKFMQRFNISPKLSGKIVSHFQYREEQYKKTDKQIFINELSIKLARSYQSIPFKNQTKQFIPRFVKRISIQSSLFYESLSQKFYNPEDQFSPIQVSNQDVQRIMYFIPENCVVYRKIQTGTSLITEKAKKKTWLGLNSFFTSQHDENQKWTVSSPMELNAINFSHFTNLIKSQQRYYQKFLEECHASMCLGEYMEERNKCLICWCGYHSSKNCTMHRPEIKRKDKMFLLRSLTVGQLEHLIKIKPRSKFTRSNKIHKKMIKFSPLKIAPQDKTTQTEHLDYNSFVNFKRIFIVRQRQSIANWLYYMSHFNISNYENQKQQKKLSLFN